MKAQQFEIEINSADQMSDMAVKLSQYLRAGDVIALEGDLGAGKTTFTKGLAKGLGVKKNVNSPTFTIIKEYKGRMPLYHMDVYRLEDTLEDLGFDEYFHGNGLTVVEWAHIIEDYLPIDLLTIEILHRGATNRKVVFKPSGERYNLLCKEFFDEYIIN